MQPHVRMLSFGRRADLFLSVCGLIWAGSACNFFEEEDGSSEAAQIEKEGPSLYRPGNRFSGWGGQGDEYLDEIQPILGKRCVTCHGCSTAACQLKLTSYDGVMRGATQHSFFQNVTKTEDRRLKDGVAEEAWRRKGFYSVVEGGDRSIMFKMLEHGKADNREGFKLENAFGLYKDKVENLTFECLDTRSKLQERLSMSGTGMPFGLPALPANEYETLTSWLVEGAHGPSRGAQEILAMPRDENAVAVWDDFFNQSSPKAQLSARFLYEHLFYARVHIDDSDASRGDFFEIVRAKNRTGPIEEIVTERPNDDPGKPFFYRLRKHTQLITAKDHIVMHLDRKVMNRWKELFLDSPWDTSEVPGYSEQNPFKYFDKIPGKIRYQFMLENSHHLIDAMVKGDVCNGSSATYAIRDRFFTLFLKPGSDPSAIDPKLGNKTYFHLDPTSSSVFRDINFERQFEDALRRLRPNGLSVEDLWDGNKCDWEGASGEQGCRQVGAKRDKNAWITVFRHGTSSSAHQGPMGQFPETMWVLDFGNFERLYYDLVVLYVPWNPVTHKLSTWRTMSHVRAHAEDLFLLFLPEEYRDTLRKEFTPSRLAQITEFDMRGKGYPSATSDLDPRRPTQDFVSRVRRHLGPEIAGFTPLDPDPMTTPPGPTDIHDRDSLEAVLYGLSLDRGKISNDLPDVTWLTIDAGSETYEYSLLANRIYRHNSRLIGDFMKGITRRPELDSLSVVRGHIGAFPQLFLRMPIEEVAQAVKAGRGEREDRLTVRNRYEIKRNTNEFWDFLDEEHTRLVTDPDKRKAVEAGIIDTSRYVWPLSMQRDVSGPLPQDVTGQP